MSDEKKSDVPGPDSLTERLNLWRSRATHDSYTDRAVRDRVVRGAQMTDGFANAIRQAHKAAEMPGPQIGDVAAITCPHCDGPMYVISMIFHDEVIVECPKCSGKKGPTT